MTDPVQLDMVTAMDARRRGMARVELSSAEFLAEVRAIAIRLGREQERVTIDDVRTIAAARGLEAPSPKAWGPTFNDGSWERAGLTRSKQVQGHGNLIRMWSLKHDVKHRVLASNHCARMCREPEFQAFMDAGSEAQCAVNVRAELKIASRAELDTKPRKKALWLKTVDAFEVYQRIGEIS